MKDASLLSFEVFKARWDEYDRLSDAMRSRSPILWWFKYQFTGYFWDAVRHVKSLSRLPWWLFVSVPRRLRQGFWDHECWNLDATIARFALPRLRRLRDIQHGIPGGTNEHEWAAALHEIEWFLSVHSGDSNELLWSADQVRYEQAGALFGKYFGALWD